MAFVRGDAGKASKRAHALEQLKRIETGRKISFWYGGGNRREIFYVDDYCQFVAEYEGFEHYISGSDQDGRRPVNLEKSPPCIILGANG